MIVCEYFRNLKQFWCDVVPARLTPVLAEIAEVDLYKSYEGSVKKAEDWIKISVGSNLKNQTSNLEIIFLMICGFWNRYVTYHAFE